MVNFEEIVVKITGKDGLSPILARNATALKNVNRNVATLGTSWKSNSAEMLKSRANVDNYNTSLAAAQKQITGGLTPAMKGIDTSKLSQMGMHATESQKKVQGLTARFNGLRNTLNGMGGVVTGLIGLGLGAWVKNGMDKAIHSQHEWAKLDRVLQAHGGTLNTAKKELRGLANEYGFAMGDVREASRVFMQAGMSYQDLTKNQGALKTAMALSVGTNRTVPESAKLLQKAYMGQGRALKDLSLDIKKYKDSKTGLIDKERLNHDILERTASQLEAHGRSGEAAMMRYNSAMERLQTTIGEKLLPVLTPILNNVTNIIDKFIEAPPYVHTFVAVLGALAAGLMVVVPVLSMFWGNLMKIVGVGKNVGGLFKRIFSGKAGIDTKNIPISGKKGKIPGMERLSNLVSGLRGKLTSGLSKISSSLRSIPGKITNGLGKISSSLKSSLSNIPGSLSRISSRLGSIGGKISSNLSKVSSNLRSGLSKIPNNLNRISSSLRSGLGRVSSELSRIKSTSSGGLGDLGGRGGKSGKGTGHLGKITSKIPGLGRLGGISGKLGGLGRLGGLASGAARFAGPIGVALTAATAGYSAYSGWNETKGPWQEKAKGAVGGAVEQLSMGLVNKKQVMNGLNWLQNAFKDLPGKIQAALGNLWQIITNPLVKAWDNAKTIVGQGVTIVQNFFKNLVDNARSILGRLWQIITTSLKRAWDNAKSIVGKGVQRVQNFFKNLIANARSILSGIWNAIVGNFKPALDWLGANIWPKIQPIIDGFNSMKSTVTDSVKGIYDKVMEYLGPVAALLDRVTGVIYGRSPGILPGFRKMGRDIPRNVESILPSVNTFRNSLNASLSTTEALRRGLPDIGLYPTHYTGPNPTSVGSIANSRGDGVNHVDNSSHHYHYGPVTINAKDMSRHELKSLIIEIFEDAR